jgi:hypothetical protein
LQIHPAVHSFILDALDDPGLYTIRMQLNMSRLDLVRSGYLTRLADLTVLFKFELHGVKEASLLAHLFCDGLELVHCLLFLRLQLLELPS